MTNEELAQVEANIAFLNAQTMRIGTLLQAENEKMFAETTKLRKETKWYPFVAIAAYNTLIAALIGALVVLLTRHP